MGQSYDARWRDRLVYHSGRRRLRQVSRQPLKKSARSIAAPILRLSEGWQSDVALAINREIGRYLDVYRFVTGPVGSDLSCHVTYNRRNILSFYFSGPPIATGLTV